MLDTSRSLLIEQSGCHVASHSVYTKLFIIKIYTVLSIGNGLQERYVEIHDRGQAFLQSGSETLSLEAEVKLWLRWFTPFNKLALHY